MNNLNIEKKHWDVLDKAKLVGKNYIKVEKIIKMVVFFEVVSCT